MFTSDRDLPLSASFYFRRPVPLELRTEAAAPDDGLVAEPVPHRIQRRVDVAVGQAGRPPRHRLAAAGGGGAGRRGRTQARGGPNRGSMPRGCAPSAEADQTWCYPVRRGMTRDRAGSSDVVRSTRNTTRGWRIGSISGGFQGTHGPIRAWTVQNLFRGAAGRASATQTSRPVIAAHGATGRADAANHGHAPDDRRLTRPPTGAAPARSPRTARGRCRRPAQVSTRSPPGGAGGRMAVPQRIPVVLLHHPVGGSCQGQDLSRAFHQAERVIRCRRPPSSPPRARPATPG